LLQAHQHYFWAIRAIEEQWLKVAARERRTFSRSQKIGVPYTILLLKSRKIQMFKTTQSNRQS